MTEKKPASLMAVVALTLSGLALLAFGGGYALSCDRDARSRGAFSGECWFTGVTIAFGGGGTAVGTWLKNPWLRQEEPQAEPAGAEPALPVAPPPGPPPEDVAAAPTQLDYVLAQLEALRQRIDAVKHPEKPDAEPESFVDHHQV